MSSTGEPLSISTEDPVYYTELLKEIPSLVDRSLLSDERSCPRIPGIQGVDDTLARRLQTLFDDIASISLCENGNVSATTACLKTDKGTLKTQLYIVFNHQEDEAPSRCRQHLQSIFAMLRQVPYTPPAIKGSPQFIAGELEGYLIDICTAIHAYSFSIFERRVTKRQHQMSKISKVH
jgi:hypothetical protein